MSIFRTSRLKMRFVDAKWATNEGKGEEIDGTRLLIDETGLEFKLSIVEVLEMNGLLCCSSNVEWLPSIVIFVDTGDCDDDFADNNTLSILSDNELIFTTELNGNIIKHSVISAARSRATHGTRYWQNCHASIKLH